MLTISFKPIPCSKWLLIALLLLSLLKTYGQLTPDINKPVNALTAYRQAMPAEKVYLQLDKPNYAIGDTIWFKAYVFNAAFLTPSTQSGLLYVQFANQNNNVVKTVRVPVAYGLSSGYITLTKEDFADGSYTLRAYTNWMRNFDTEAVFKKDLTISNAGAGAWLVASSVKLVNTAGRQQVRAQLAFSTIDGRRLGLREVELTVAANKKILTKGAMQTGLDGSLEVNVPLGDRADAGQLQLTVSDLRKDEVKQQLTIPLDVQRPSDTDLQFMPEGGSLVANLPNRIAFKAISTNGKGIPVSGSLINRAGQEIGTFQSAHQGMGTVALVPRASDQYTARVQLADGSIKTFSLPDVKPTGTVLNVRPNFGRDSLTVSLKATADLLGGKYYLIGQVAGVVCYAAEANLNLPVTTVQIAKVKFPEGIVRFTLLNQQQQPLNERVVYNDRQDRLNIQIKNSKKNYAPRDSISLDIEVCDAEGKPVQGSFSLAVTDNAQVRPDTVGEANILTSTLLTADLKGYIENPAHYLQNQPANREALDNLLLTQGWVGYSWADVFKGAAKPTFEAEPELAVKGRVNNIVHKPVKGTRVKIMSARPLLVTDTLTGDEGIFKFTNLPQADTVAYILQALNKKGKDVNVGIEMSDPKPAQFAAAQQLSNPWYNNSDTSLLNQLKTNRSREDAVFKMPGRALKEITITDVRKYKDIVGVPFLVIDEKEVVKAGKKSLLTLLYEKIPGFREGSIGKYHIPYFFIKNRPVSFTFDRIRFVDIFIPEPPAPGFTLDRAAFFNFSKGIIQQYTAEDIVDIGVFENTIEIFTRSGDGPYKKPRPGFYLYKPLPVTWPKEFYRPRYAVNTPAPLPDTRATIHWEPFVATGTNGKATVSFYAADRKTTYTVITEGSDMNGRLGLSVSKVNISE